MERNRRGITMLKWLQMILIGMIAIIIIMFAQLFAKTGKKQEENISLQDPSHHLQIIIQNTDEYFWNLFKEGAQEAGEELGVYVEFVAVEGRSTSVIKEVVEKAVNSGVDGIGFQPPDGIETQEFIRAALEEGVSVITYENHNFNIINTPMVGSNSYSVGSLAGDMGVKATMGIGNVVVIITDSGEEGGLFYRNLIMQGIKESFSNYGALKIIDVYNINKDKFEAEKVASSIISEVKDVDLIICLDERSTPGVAQVLVDNNLVGDIGLIGYGMMPQTLEYLNKGVIYGAVCPNAYEIGYKTVEQLTLSLNQDQISDYTNTELYMIDSSNIAEYILEDSSE